MYAMAKKPEILDENGGISVLWARPRRASRGPRPAHSRDWIASAAVKVADENGIGAVSMRRVAAEVGTRATSLYRYLRSKEEMLDLMVDLVMGESTLPESSGEWRPDLRMIAHHMRATIKRHPWMISVSVRSTLGPNSLATTEATLKALDGRGLDADGMLAIATALSTFTRGYVAVEIAEQRAEMNSGLRREQWMASQAHYIEVIRKSGKYPLFMRIVDEARTPHDPEHASHGFDEGLECLLDGIAARLL